MEIKIPLNNELLTTAKIIDLEKIDRSMVIKTLYRSIQNLSNDGELTSSDTKEILDAMIFFKDMADNELTPTETLKTLMVKSIQVLNNYITANIKLIDGEKALLSSTFSLMVNELVEIAGKLLLIKKPIVNSLIVSELEKVLVEINKQPHASVAKLNSLFYLNTNRLHSLHLIVDKIMKDYAINMSRIDTMLDLIDVADAYEPERISNALVGIWDIVTGFQKQLVFNRYINNGKSNDNDNHTIYTVDTNDEEILNGISNLINNINNIYTTFSTDKLVRLFNWENEKLTPYVGYDIKNKCIEVKLRIDTILEIVTNTTDSLNTTVAKLKKSLPTEDNEIDDLDTI